LNPVGKVLGDAKALIGSAQNEKPAFKLAA